MMLLPRFTIRTGLTVLTAAAVLSLAGRAALRGESWAVGLLIGIVSAGFVLLVHAAFFSVAVAIGPKRTSAGPRTAPPSPSEGEGT